jgi:hypothetical protein
LREGGKGREGKGREEKEIVTRLDSSAGMNLARILCKSNVIRMDSQIA